VAVLSVRVRMVTLGVGVVERRDDKMWEPRLPEP
jgi:hypothetical protein